MLVGAVFGAVLMGICLAGIVIKKVTGGSSCCGEKEKSVKRIRAADRNTGHYPYRYLAEIDGMVCGNCARVVENAFHQKGDIYATVDLGRKTAILLTKYPFEREDIIDILRKTPYTLINFQEEAK